MTLLGSGFRVDQVGIVVGDLDAAIARYAATFACGPWEVWTYGPDVMAESSFRGAPGSFAMRLALAGSNPQIELIEPLSGPSLYHEWLAERGEGLHHLGMRVGDLAAAVGELERSGHRVLQSGRGYGQDGDGGFAYLDTTAELGVVLELIEAPAVRRPPEATVA
jgi:methylmalonyl-CoA/ethylmalonyl-CoA epimerase